VQLLNFSASITIVLFPDDGVSRLATLQHGHASCSLIISSLPNKERMCECVWWGGGLRGCGSVGVSVCAYFCVCARVYV